LLETWVWFGYCRGRYEGERRAQLESSFRLLQTMSAAQYVASALLLPLSPLHVPLSLHFSLSLFISPSHFLYPPPSLSHAHTLSLSEPATHYSASVVISHVHSPSLPPCLPPHGCTCSGGLPAILMGDLNWTDPVPRGKAWDGEVPLPRGPDTKPTWYDAWSQAKRRIPSDSDGFTYDAVRWSVSRQRVPCVFVLFPRLSPRAIAHTHKATSRHTRFAEP
jgi:hypothetical protein